MLLPWFVERKKSRSGLQIKEKKRSDKWPLLKESMPKKDLLTGDEEGQQRWR